MHGNAPKRQRQYNYIPQLTGALYGVYDDARKERK